MFFGDWISIGDRNPLFRIPLCAKQRFLSGLGATIHTVPSSDRNPQISLRLARTSFCASVHVERVLWYVTLRLPPSVECRGRIPMPPPLPSISSMAVSHSAPLDFRSSEVRNHVLNEMLPLRLGSCGTLTGGFDPDGAKSGKHDSNIPGSLAVVRLELGLEFGALV